MVFFQTALGFSAASLFDDFGKDHRFVAPHQRSESFLNMPAGTEIAVFDTFGPSVDLLQALNGAALV